MANRSMEHNALFARMRKRVPRVDHGAGRPAAGHCFPGLLLLIAALALAGPAPAQTLVPEGSTITANPQQPLEVQLISGSLCYLVTFEGGGHLNQIYPETGGLVPGTPIRFAPNWLTVTSGFYANNPSVPTIALFLGNTAQVIFEQPVARVSFYYASLSPVSIEAFGVTGTLLTSSAGPANFDDDSGFTVWDELGVNLGIDQIWSLRVTGQSGATGIDDFMACQESFRLIEAEIDLHPDNYPNETDPYNTASNKPVDLGVLSTADFDATTIDVGTALLGDPTLAGAVAARSCRSEDLNGDGLADLVIDFGPARDFGEAGALSADSTEVRFTALTLDGDYVTGLDTVTIVGN